MAYTIFYDLKFRVRFVRRVASIVETMARGERMTKRSAVSASTNQYAHRIRFHWFLANPARLSCISHRLRRSLCDQRMPKEIDADRVSAHRIVALTSQHKRDGDKTTKTKWMWAGQSDCSASERRAHGQEAVPFAHYNCVARHCPSIHERRRRLAACGRLKWMTRHSGAIRCAFIFSARTAKRIRNEVWAWLLPPNEIPKIDRKRKKMKLVSWAAMVRRTLAHLSRVRK